MRRIKVALSVITLAISGLSASPALAVADGTVPCTTGSFEIQTNIVISHSSCTGNAVIPDGVTEIADLAFNRASGLTSITIPTTVTKIGNSAFGQATSLTSITIPSSVTSIAMDAFYLTTSLTSINVDAGNNNYKSVNGVLFDKSGLTIISYPTGINSTSYTIPSGVITIGSYSFVEASRLTSVTIPSSVTTIKHDAFLSASGLTSLTIPSSVTTMEDSAFGYTTSLKTVTFEPGSKLTTIGTYAFNGSSALTSIRIPASVVTIDGDAFDGATALAEVTFEPGSNLSTIAEWAFYQASALTSITIPSSVTTIGNGAFYDASALTSVYFLGNAPATVGVGAFLGAGGQDGATAYKRSSSTGFPNAGSPWNELTMAIGVYTATFNSNGGSSVAATDFIKNGAITAPSAPTRSGYKFAGWSATNGGSVVKFPYSPQVNADLTLYAKWTSNSITPATNNTKKSIKFSTSSSVLTKANKAALKKLVKLSGKDASYVITGTAGRLPGVTEAHVKNLAKLRANVVKDYLVKLGVKKSSIKVKAKVVNQGIVPKTKILTRYLDS